MLGGNLDVLGHIQIAGMELTVASVIEQLQAWQLEPDPVTAVACFNDFHAAVCLTAAAALGL